MSSPTAMASLLLHRTRALVEAASSPSATKPGVNASPFLDLHVIESMVSMLTEAQSLPATLLCQDVVELVLCELERIEKHNAEDGGENRVANRDGCVAALLQLGFVCLQQSANDRNNNSKPSAASTTVKIARYAY